MIGQRPPAQSPESSEEISKTAYVDVATVYKEAQASGKGMHYNLKIWFRSNDLFLYLGASGEQLYQPRQNIAVDNNNNGEAKV